jgi:predicted nuclease of predicted toxin-antitoxin system
MRILLDENLDWRLQRDLTGHEVESVHRLGWTGIRNGMLLKKAVEARFDALVTMDGNMVYQQELSAYGIAVLVLRARSNRLSDTRPLIPALLEALPGAPKGQRTVVGP